MTEYSSMESNASTGLLSETNTVFDYVAFRLRLVPDQLYEQLVLIWPISWLIIILPGLWANAINIRTFFRMGLDSSVTVLFFSLAVADFAHLFFPVGNVLAMTLLFVEKNFSAIFKIQPLAVVIYLVNVANMFNTWACLLTAFLSVQRSLCIFLPFHFKSIFTNARTWFIVTLFGAYSAVPAVLYIFVTFDIRSLSISLNRTQLVIVPRSSYVAIQKYTDLLYMGTSVTCQVLSLGSLIVMAWSLAASVRFRQNVSATTTTANARDEMEGADADNEVKGHSGQGGKKGHGSKERIAIIQVALLAAIYLVTSLPKIATSLVSYSDPEFGLNGKRNNEFLFSFFLRFTFDYVNSATNFLVYYKWNSSFRKLCFASSNQLN